MAVDHLVAKLEAITAELYELDADDFPAVSQAMNERSRLVGLLKETFESTRDEVPEEIRERLQAQLRGGEGLIRRLRVRRASASAELSDLSVKGQLLQALPQDRSGGRLLEGRDRLEERYRTDYPPERRGRLSFSDLRVIRLGPDAALAIGRFHLEQSAGSEHGLFTVVFRRGPDGWRILHDHSSGELEEE